MRSGALSFQEDYETRLQAGRQGQIHPHDRRPCQRGLARGLQTLFPAKQLDALIENLQCADSIEEDIDNDVNYFLVFLGSSLIGYFAWKMENTSLHLLHLYLKPEYRGKAIGRDIVASCERLARGEGRGRVWCGVNAKALPVQQFFKARGYRSLGPAESEGGIERNELILERML